MKNETLDDRVWRRISRRRRNVFMREDFADLGGYDQIGRSLRNLVRNGRLLKIGKGLYARAVPSLIDGRPVPNKGLRSLTVEALSRLGVGTVPTRLERAYNAGWTTQVPSGRVIGVTKRVRRKIGYGGNYVSLKRA